MNPRESIRKPEVGETETKIGETGSGRDKNKERGKRKWERQTRGREKCSLCSRYIPGILIISFTDIMMFNSRNRRKAVLGPLNSGWN